MFRHQLSLLVLLTGITISMSAGTSTARAEQQPAPPGKLVAVDGVQLHLYCQGGRRGGPTVVLDAGLGGMALEWEAVQAALSSDMRVCSYDRAGMGWSDASAAPRTVSRMVKELRDLLQRGGVESPYLLVGHSFGGYVAQLFAQRYRDDTVGIVLVDSSHPEQVERFLAPPISVNTVPRRRTGVQFMSPPPAPSALPAHLRPTAESLLAEFKSMRTVHEELMNFRVSAHQVRDAHVRLQVPVVVVSRGRQEWSRGSKAVMKEQLWRALQQELSRLSPHSAHLLALESGHHIHLEQPQLIADAVRLLQAEVSGAGCDNEGAGPLCALDPQQVAWLGNSLRLAASTVALKAPGPQLLSSH